jgi:hypothetical protein
MSPTVQPLMLSSIAVWDSTCSAHQHRSRQPPFMYHLVNCISSLSHSGGSALLETPFKHHWQARYATLEGIRLLPHFHPPSWHHYTCRMMQDQHQVHCRATSAVIPKMLSDMHVRSGSLSCPPTRGGAGVTSAACPLRKSENPVYVTQGHQLAEGSCGAEQGWLDRAHQNNELGVALSSVTDGVRSAVRHHCFMSSLIGAVLVV